MTTARSWPRFPLVPVPAPQGMTVRVLGPVTVSGWDTPDRYVGPLTEIAVYLACHPGRAATVEQLRDALGSGPDRQVKEQTVHAYMTRLRRATRGALSDARPGYQLTALTCDLAAFDAHLAAAAATDDRVEQREQLTAGLAWVTGPPFSGPAGDWRWVDKDNLRAPTERRVDETVTRLGALALADRDPDLACWAAYQGFLADPTNPDHNMLALAAATSTGHPGDLKTEWAAVTGRYRGQG